MKFTKMHGCGNDYVYVNCLQEQVKHPEQVAVYVSDRHFGIGSDGLILIQPSEVADFRMAMYNADGSEGQMCGNGIRCVAKYVYDYGLTDKTSIAIETLAGIKYLDLTVNDGKVEMVKVNMGAPILKPGDIPVTLGKEICIAEKLTVDGKEYEITAVSMGNPHAVTFVEDTASLPLEQIGPGFEHHTVFPERINTEFVQIINRKEVNMRVWERGSGETLACGTGTCATVVACVLNGLTEEEITVHLIGGDLVVKYDRENDTVWMTGPATVVFDGEIDLPAWEEKEI
ncbi:MAG: diaminopimelate epimerase [Eubacteriales bacterium]|nr:diaminopimelate epimerase [Eubacteriales bacterium]